MWIIEKFQCPISFKNHKTRIIIIVVEAQYMAPEYIQGGTRRQDRPWGWDMLCNVKFLFAVNIFDYS